MKKNVIMSAVAIAIAMGIMVSNGSSVFADSTYVVQKNDNLWNIAKEKLGSGTRYGEIFEANKDKIKEPSKISVGQVLVIPNETSSSTTPSKNNKPAETPVVTPVVSEEIQKFVGSWTEVAMFLNNKPATKIEIARSINKAAEIAEPKVFEKPEKLTIKDDKTLVIENGYLPIKTTVEIKDGILHSASGDGFSSIVASLNFSDSTLFTEMTTDDGIISTIYFKDTTLTDPNGKLEGSWIASLVSDVPDGFDAEIPSAMKEGSKITFNESKKSFNVECEGKLTDNNVSYTTQNGFVTLALNDKIKMPFATIINAKGELVALKSMPLLDSNGLHYSCVLEPMPKTVVPFSPNDIPGRYKDVISFDGYSSSATKIMDNFQIRNLNTDSANYYDTLLLREDGTGAYILSGKETDEFSYTVDEVEKCITLFFEKDGDTTEAYMYYSEETGRFYLKGTNPYDIVYAMSKQQ